jgi:hypothetical protein
MHDLSQSRDATYAEEQIDSLSSVSLCSSSHKSNLTPKITFTEILKVTPKSSFSSSSAVFLTTLLCGLFLASSEARLGSSRSTTHNSIRGLRLPTTRFVPTPSPTANPVFLFDTPVQVINIASERYLNAGPGPASVLVAGEACASLNPPDNNSDGQFLWTFRYR